MKWTFSWKVIPSSLSLSNYLPSIFLWILQPCPHLPPTSLPWFFSLLELYNNEWCWPLLFIFLHHYFPSFGFIWNKQAVNLWWNKNFLSYLLFILSFLPFVVLLEMRFKKAKPCVSSYRMAAGVLSSFNICQISKLPSGNQLPIWMVTNTGAWSAIARHVLQPGEGHAVQTSTKIHLGKRTQETEQQRY